jgi:hypothetical protein
MLVRGEKERKRTGFKLFNRVFRLRGDNRSTIIPGRSNLNSSQWEYQIPRFSVV